MRAEQPARVESRHPPLAADPQRDKSACGVTVTFGRNNSCQKGVVVA